MHPDQSECASQKEVSHVSKPHSNDFLFGRGGAISRHPGNVFFHQLIKIYKLDYRGNTRDARKRLAYKVYAEVKGADPPGRFLMRDKQGWVEVSEEKTIVKISQSLSDERRKLSSLSDKVNRKDNIIQSKNKVLAPEDNPTLKTKDVIDDLSSNNVYQKETKSMSSLNENPKFNVVSDTRAASSGKICSSYKPNHYRTIQYPPDNMVSKTVILASNKPNSYSTFKDEYLCQSVNRYREKPDFVGSVTNGMHNSCNSGRESDEKAESNSMLANGNHNHIVQNCMMSLSCIGQSFLSDKNEFEEDSTRIYKDLAELHHNEKHSIFYLPSIVVSLCKRIRDLEERLESH